jgi:hypothetical protein
MCVQSGLVSLDTAPLMICCVNLGLQVKLVAKNGNQRSVQINEECSSNGCRWIYWFAFDRNVSAGSAQVLGACKRLD